MFTAAAPLSGALSPSAGNFRLIPGHFDSTSGDGLLLQSQIRGQSNYLARINKTSITNGIPLQPLVPKMAPETLSSKTDETIQSTALPGAIVTPTAFGRTPGQFSVSSTGGATYTIPLRAPPGAGRAQLKLALTYNNRAPNGIMGMGWSIAGLSAITRCNKTVAQDGAAGPVTLQLSSTYSDRFCLDGKQLKLTSSSYGYANSTYATEIETFSLVAAGSTMVGNGPASFTVTTKNGLVYTYGGTTDSEVLAGSSGTIRTWALSQIADRVGNKISLVYQQSNGGYRIDHILYPTTASGQGPFYEMLFTYGARPTNDIPSAYIDGYLVTEPNQLNSITTEVYPAGTVIKTYNLAYTQSTTTNRNILTALQECSASTCLPSTSIGYQASAQGWSTTAGSVSTTGIPVLADLNGDGLPDLVYVDYATTTLFVQLATSTGFAAPVHTGFSASKILGVGRFLGNGQQQLLVSGAILNYNSTSGTFSSAAAPAAYGIQVADIDGDGLDDLVTIPGLGFGQSMRSYHNTTVPPGPVTFGAPVVIYTASSTQLLRPTSVFGGGIVTADFNGDGRADILAVATTSNNSIVYVTPLLSNGASSAFTPLTTFQYSSNAGFPLETAPIITDWNGDGCSDFITTNTSGSLVAVQVSNCAGGFTEIDTALSTSAVNFGYSVDWDGDGRQDLLYVSPLVNGSLYLLRSTGTGYGASTLIRSSLYPTAIADVNGDGLPDLMVATGLQQGGANTYYLHNGANTPPDVATSFTDGFGMNQSPTYVALTNTSYYSKYSTAVYPEQDYQFPLYVVNQFTASDGTGSTYQDSFYYYGARSQVQGRGFEGFATRRTYDSRNALYTYDYYQQTFPYTGLEYQRIVSNGTHYTQEVTSTPNTQTLTGLGGYQTRWFTYLSPETTTLWETGGSKDGDQILQSTKTTTFGDGYGNPTQIVVSTTDQDSASPVSPFNGLTWTRTINSTFYNDTTHNCLGLLDTLSDQSAVPGQTTQTRNDSYLADTTNCRITQETIEPNVSGLQVTTVYGFDTCGNTSSVAVTGENPNGTAMTTRTTSYNYSYLTSRCQLPEQISNALGQATSIAYNYNFGVPATVTDPNTLVTSYLQDDYGRNTRVTRPDSTYTTTSFSSCSASQCWGVTNLHFYVIDIDYGSDASWTCPVSVDSLSS